MSSQKKCPDCGSLEIVEDSHYTQNQVVCADCGFILTEGLFTTTIADEEQMQDVMYSLSTGQKAQQSRCLKRGVNRVQDLCKILVLPSLFEETAVSYYQRAIKRPCFGRISLARKEIIVGCCVFVTCRQHNWPVTMGTISLLLYADKELFARTYLRFLKELEIDVPALSLASLVRTCVSRQLQMATATTVVRSEVSKRFSARAEELSFKLCQKPPSVPAQFAEEKEQLVAQTVEMVELASRTWLVTGRHPVPMVMAAAYLAWQSLRPTDRLSCTLPRFCQLAGTDLPQPAKQRLKELRDVLLKMSSQLAWLRVLKLNRKTVAKHLGDLLRHRHFLLRAAFREVESTEGCGATNSAPEGQESLEQSGVVLAEASRAGDTLLHRGRKRAPLLPPCILNPAKKLRNPDPSPEDSAAAEDEPISDSEIEQYIRLPEEEELFSKAQACLRQSSRERF
ncbi:hypothetical protein JRQ81_011008 [Phrynocephalus forsythii]|uniref:Transcription factor IIIB 50 kDa subunit n=1 Tax=Phrynocephalus forsythii TaxID=171643 RepID=A0A9Q1ARC5_9SAUR|nr:hypothetical protein JRQ81_011008 [Phrynocephalus forsythii]